MTTEMTTLDAANLPLTAVQIKGQVQLIQEVMESVMKDGTHYGKIPGCGDKKTLLKPGAEKLCLTFRLRPIIGPADITITDMGNDHRDYEIRCHIYNSTGQELATGVGSCSTKESKYRYRGGMKIATENPVPKDYWNLKKEGKFKEAQELIGGRGFGATKNDAGGWVICEIGEKQENTDIADTYNTVLKMAKKRATIDGLLSATAASDIFTQDLEDMAENHAAATGAATTADTTKDKAESKQSVSAKAKGTIEETVITVEKYNPKDGKFPHTIEAKGKRYGSYDEDMAKIMKSSQGQTVQIRFHVEVVRGREYPTLDEILPVRDADEPGGEGDAQ